MQTENYALAPPSLEELAADLKGSLAENYEIATVEAVQCPDLHQEPFCLATGGLPGDEKVTDIGNRPNLFPTLRVKAKLNMLDIARAMEM